MLRLIGCVVRLIGLIRISYCMRNTTYVTLINSMCKERIADLSILITNVTKVCLILQLLDFLRHFYK